MGSFSRLKKGPSGGIGSALFSQYSERCYCGQKDGVIDTPCTMYIIAILRIIAEIGRLSGKICQKLLTR